VQRNVSTKLEVTTSFLRPQAEFFYIYCWLIKIYGCFSAKPENFGEGIFATCREHAFHWN